MLQKLCFLSGKAAGFTIAKTILSTRRKHSLPVQSVIAQSKAIAGILHEHGCKPDRLGIDGVPGSGKSTLARTLASRLGMEWKSLDFQNVGLPGIFEQPNTIFEHHRLLRARDVDAFDAIIHFDEPVVQSRAKLARRGRGQIMAALLDFNKMKNIGRIAFEVCEGEPILVPDSNIAMKIKPSGGFRALENISAKLRAKGINVPGTDKEEMLFLLAYGWRESGLQAYLVPHVFPSLLGYGLASLLRKLRIKS